MGGEIEITHGGVIAVDPDQLRGAAGRVLRETREVAEARAELLAIPGIIDGLGIEGISALWSATAQLDRVEAALARLGRGIATMADAYELAELRARQAMLGAGDSGLARDLRQRTEQLLTADPRLSGLDARLQALWRQRVTEGFVPEDPGLLSPSSLGDALLLSISPVLFGLRAALERNARAWAQGAEELMVSGAAENGVVPPTPLAPRPGLVVRASAGAGSASAAAAPGDVVLMRPEPVRVPAALATLSGAVSRVPFAQAPQVRVERYEMADGTTRFVAYIDGTRGQSAEEPWSFDSNLAMYGEHAESDSYKATMAALRDAGADAGTPVDLVGYSQGGMIAGLVAQSGEFAVQGVFTVGSPIEPVLPEDVLSVAVRHTDDPVAGLAGGGSPGGTGSADSLVITRAVAPGHGIDPGVPAHRLDAYAETVRQAESSRDVRMDAVAEHFAVLATATSISATDYVARRIPG